MNNTIFWPSILALLVSIYGCHNPQQDQVNEEPSPKAAAFFGQAPPSMIPTPYAPGVVSTADLEIEAAISPTMDEFYFIRQRKGEPPKSHLVHYQDGEWQTTEMDRPSGEVFISPDNQTMYLGNRYKVRTNTGWTAERSLGEPFVQIAIMRLSASSTHTFVFDEWDTIGVIRLSKLTDGIRGEPIALDNEINTGSYIAHPFIAPNESYLIWDSEREGGYGGSDLYISFRQADDSWGVPINMGAAINTANDDTYGSVTADGKYFFFNRVKLGASFEESTANIFWVDAQVIMNLKI